MQCQHKYIASLAHAGCPHQEASKASTISAIHGHCSHVEEVFRKNPLATLSDAKRILLKQHGVSMVSLLSARLSAHMKECEKMRGEDGREVEALVLCKSRERETMHAIRVSAAMATLRRTCGWC
jgi:hypothetical protein